MDYSKYITEHKGTLHVLADACYTGAKIVHTKTGDRTFHYLILLFCRPKKNGDIIPRWRQVAIATKSVDTEFNLFMTAFNGHPIILGPHAVLDFDKIASDIVEEIRNDNDHCNYRVNWLSNDKYNIATIGNIERLNKMLEPKREGMYWDQSAINHYPGLKTRNNELKVLYATHSKQKNV